MPTHDFDDDPESRAADEMIREIEELRALMPPTPPPEPVIELPAPPPGSRYVVIGPAFAEQLTHLCVLAQIPPELARRKINAALAADRAGSGKLAALAQQLQRLPQVGWGSNKGQS